MTGGSGIVDHDCLLGVMAGLKAVGDTALLTGGLVGGREMVAAAGGMSSTSTSLYGPRSIAGWCPIGRGRLTWMLLEEGLWMGV